MAYVIGNPRTKRALRDMVASGRPVTVFQPGPFGPDVADGDRSVEGPHYPEPHRWYARVRIADGVIVKVIS